MPLDAAALGRIRKTAENPPRVSVYDLISAVTGSAESARKAFFRLSNEHAEVGASSHNFRFSGRGQRPTPVVDARGAVEILMLLPGRVAASFRKSAADVIVRYLGGDPSLVEEVAANRLIQEQLPDDHPSRIFGQTVESEQVKRAHEELELSRVKRVRLENFSQSFRLYREVLDSIGMEMDDRDRMYVKDCISSQFLDRQAIEDGEFCIRDVTSAEGFRDTKVDSVVGRRAKQLYLHDFPDYTFPKKDVLVNGQLVPVNLWRQSQRAYAERALQQLLSEGKIVRRTR